MAGTYELWLTDDFGVRLSDVNGRTLLTNVLAMEASRVVNDVGRLFLSLPRSFDTSLIQPDRMVQVWRKPQGGTLSIFNVYFIRKWRFVTRGSAKAFFVWGHDPNGLLERRIIPDAAGSDEADKQGLTDNIIRAVFRENFTGPTDADRTMPDMFTPSDDSLGQAMTKSFAKQEGLQIFRSISESSRSNGREIFFDLNVFNVSSTAISYILNTTINQPGQSRTDVVFSEEGGNLENAELEVDHTDEENFIYAGGQGEEDQRIVETASDSERIGVSKYGRIEGFADARLSQTSDSVQQEADDELALRRPKERFIGTPVDTEGTRFGVDWNWGDRVTARYEGREFETIVRNVTIRLDDQGRETINSRLDSEDN